MALKISIDNDEQREAASVVIYSGGVPVAAVVDIGGGIMFADAVRDKDDLARVLESLGQQPGRIVLGTDSIVGSL